MKTVQLIDQKRTGLFPEHRGHGIAPVVIDCRATIPVIEAFAAAGAAAAATAAPGTYCVTLGDNMPPGIVAVSVPDAPYLGLRMEIEPPYPAEHPDYWRQGDVTPCPRCGAPIVREPFMNRSSFRCPTCQPRPRNGRW